MGCNAFALPFERKALHDPENPGASRPIPTMVEAGFKRAHWRLKLSYPLFSIFHYAGMQYKTANTLSRFKSNVEDRTTLDDEVPVLTVCQELFACAPLTETFDFKTMQESKRLLCAF